MWFLTRFVLISGIAFSLLQSANITPEEQNSSPMKSEPGSSSQAATKPRESAGPNVGATQPVITVHGLCAHSGQANTGDATTCSKTLNREQFEGLVTALNPEGQALPPNGRQNLAKTYAEY